MMMIPRRSGFDIFDEVFNDPFFTKKETKLMKTDVKEKEGDYILDIDIPGYEKEDIKMELENGYLIITATKDESKEEKGKHDNYICKERFIGQCSRSYYVGENVREEDIKASYKNGTLHIILPKEQPKQIEETKKYIPIGD